MRVTDLSTFGTMTRHVQQGRDQLSQQQERIASGRQALRLSDDPNTLKQAARTDQQLLDVESWLSNIRDSRGWEQHTEAGIDQLIDGMQRLQEVTISALDGTKTAEDRQALATEVNSVLELFVSTGNRQVDGSYLFSGAAMATAPIDATRTDGQITAIAYAGATAARQVTLAPGVEIASGAVIQGANGLLANSAHGYDLLAEMISLRDTLALGERPVEELPERLSQGLEALASGLVRSGVNQQRLEAADQQLDNEDLHLREKVDDLTALDMSAAVIELNRLQVTFQASLQMAANLQQLSLMKFL